jgi:hypothetical protein
VGGKKFSVHTRARGKGQGWLMTCMTHGYGVTGVPFGVCISFWLGVSLFHGIALLLFVSLFTAIARYQIVLLMKSHVRFYYLSSCRIFRE